ncbi:MAG: DUF885 family protein [Anaerolineales bacterium]|nr:DUF885 family protein [Anaerolineales bacterium]
MLRTQAPLFNNWLDDFFAAYYRRRPVNATFIGQHVYDHLLPDYSDHGIGDTVAEMEDLLRQLREFPDEPLSSIEIIDRHLAQGFLEIQLWEYRSNHFQFGNPCSYTGEAIFGILALFLTDFAPISERVESAIERLEATPNFLRQGVENIRRSPAAWVERAIRECNGAINFLTEGVNILIREYAITNERFRRAADRATAAFAAFRDYLKSELRPQPSQNYACGEEVLDLLMHKGHFLSLSPEEIATYGQVQLEEAQSELDQRATDFNASSPEEALSQLNDVHPTAQVYLSRYQEIWEAARAACIAYDQLTWPDFPILYTPIPNWARKAAADLYFLYYRAPAAFNRPPIHHYLVPPLDADLPAAEVEAFLRANNDSVIKLNHVVHHGGLGHHIQNWHAYRSASRIGQIAAIDCASRIAMFCGGTMAEGWAVYATSLIAETDFLTPLEQYSEIHSRRRMCARAIVDVRLHQGRFTLEDATTFYQQYGGMNKVAARNEAIKNSMFPGAAMMYLIGCDRIKKLRREVSLLQGDRFNLRNFHDTFLSYGSIPVELIARDMLALISH